MILAFTLGVLIGFVGAMFLLSLCAAARRADEEMDVEVVERNDRRRNP